MTTVTPADVNTQSNEAAATTLGGKFSTPVNDTQAMYHYMIAWTFIILLFVLLSRTKVGHTLVYYSLLLMLAFVLVTQYQWVQYILDPIIGSKSDRGGSGEGK